MAIGHSPKSLCLADQCPHLSYPVGDERELLIGSNGDFVCWLFLVTWFCLEINVEGRPRPTLTITVNVMKRKEDWRTGVNVLWLLWLSQGGDCLATVNCLFTVLWMSYDCLVSLSGRWLSCNWLMSVFWSSFDCLSTVLWLSFDCFFYCLMTVFWPSCDCLRSLSGRCFIRWWCRSWTLKNTWWNLRSEIWGNFKNPTKTWSLWQKTMDPKIGPSCRDNSSRTEVNASWSSAFGFATATHIGVKSV
jgi:hypothetical protein